jgi:Mor family transcriptional regulator
MTRRRSLTDSQVSEIRSAHLAYIRGRGYESLAKKYGVGASTIRDVITYRSYQWVIDL